MASVILAICFDRNTFSISSAIVNTAFSKANVSALPPQFRAFLAAVLPMRVDGTWYRTIWLHNETTVKLIDQRHLPHEFLVEDITTVDAMAEAIRDMHLRGAGLIGCAAAFGMYLAAREAARAAGS